MNFNGKAFSTLAIALLLSACNCCKVGDKGSNYDECKGRMAKAGYLVDKDGNRLVLDRVFFTFDHSSLTGESQKTLHDQMEWLQANPDMQIVIQGHCDERGTREYNIGLGERRANAAKEYLVSMGISADRITVVSKGKDDPIVTGSNEEAWAQNRVAITVRS